MFGRDGGAGKRRPMPENKKLRRIDRTASASLFAGHRAEVFMHSAQQIDQQFLLVFAEAGQQPPLAPKGDRDDLVMGDKALRRQRDRMGAAVIGIDADGNQPPLLHSGERPAHRPLVETNDVADACGRNVRLDRQQCNDPPFSGIYAKLARIERFCALGQLVGDERNEGRHIAVKIQHPYRLGPGGLGSGSARGMGHRFTARFTSTTHKGKRQGSTSQKSGGLQ